MPMSELDSAVRDSPLFQTVDPQPEDRSADGIHALAVLDLYDHRMHRTAPMNFPGGGEGVMASRFVVDLGDLKLSPGTKRRIEHGIQQAVLRELAALGGGRNLGFRFPRDWLGLILNSGKIVDLERVESQIKSGLLGR